MTYPTIGELMAKESRVSDIQFGDGNAMYYRSSTNGIGEIYKKETGQAAHKVSGTLNAGGTVGYGGGAFDVQGNILAVSEKNGGVYAIHADAPEGPVEIVPPFLRTCSPKISPNGKWVMFVYEKDGVNGLGITAINGLSWPRQLVLGADFYMQPTWHPNGELVAWVEWDHPDMPWDSSRVKMGEVGGMQLRLFEERHIDGKPGASANQPVFSPDGKWLSYVKRSGNWDSLFLYSVETREKTTIANGDGFHLRMPDWVQGLHSYQWSADSNSITFIKYHFGRASLARVDIQTGAIEDIDTAGFDWLSQIDSAEDGRIALLGSSSTTSNEILQLHKGNLITSETTKETSAPYAPEPQEIRFQNRDGKSGYGWYYPPAGMEEMDAPPPCLVKLHSGPTSLKQAGYSPETAYFTARGFAMAYVNYRGSASFGYDYQDALHLKWGQAEVEDTLDMLDELSNQGLIDKEHIAVLGSSAGGFSVLQTLIKHPGLFKAAVCSYAVSDLVDDAEHTHKFEKYYHRFLTGIYPDEKEKFIEQSPITHIDQIQDPVALFHGSEDRVVSPAQSQKIFDELTRRGIPCNLKVFAGEGHGFRQTENIEMYFQIMTEFLRKYM